MKQIHYKIIGYLFLVFGVFLIIGNLIFSESPEIRFFIRGGMSFFVGLYFIKSSKGLSGRNEKLNSYAEYEITKNDLGYLDKLKNILSLIERDHDILTYELGEQNKKLFKDLTPYLNEDEIETLQLISNKYDYQFELAAKKEKKSNHERLKKYPLDFKVNETINIEEELNKIFGRLEQMTENHG